MTNYKVSEQFKAKFNELDQLCKRIYTNYPKGFTAMRHFAETLNTSDKTTLLNLIKARNINAHDENNIISFNEDSLVFIQGLLDGLKRKYYNKSSINIDSKNENLRTKYLKDISYKVNSINNSFPYLTAGELKNVKSKFNIYIEKLRNAEGYENIRKIYFSCMEELKNLSKSNDVMQAKNRVKKLNNQRFQKNLENKKISATNELDAMYRDIIANTSVFNIITRSNAKKIYNNALNSINKCKTLDQIDDILDEIDDTFDDLDD